MSTAVEDEIKRWTAKRKSALVMEILQGKTTVAEASRAYDLRPSEIETWIDEAKRGMENALRANPLDIREQYEKQIKKRPGRLSAPDRGTALHVLATQRALGDGSVPRVGRAGRLGHAGTGDRLLQP